SRRRECPLRWRALELSVRDRAELSVQHGKHSVQRVPVAGLGRAQEARDLFRPGAPQARIHEFANSTRCAGGPSRRSGRRGTVGPSELDMRRITLVLAAVLVLSALVGVFVSDAAGLDSDDAPFALAASVATPPPDPAAMGELHAYIPSIVERHFESSPLCRGRPRRAPRAMNPSSA